MNRNAVKFDLSLVTHATFVGTKRVADVIKRAKQLQEDPDEQSRVEQHLCKACYYFPRVAGAAITTQPCACCGAEQTFSSTDTDILCPSCAGNHSLCKHCGGDIDLRGRERDLTEQKKTI